MREKWLSMQLMMTNWFSRHLYTEDVIRREKLWMDKLLSVCTLARHLAVPHCLASINYEIKNIRSLYVASDDYLTEWVLIWNCYAFLILFVCCLPLLIAFEACCCSPDALFRLHRTNQHSEILDYLKAIRLR